jgi:hypothetical protein
VIIVFENNVLLAVRLHGRVSISSESGFMTTHRTEPICQE